MSNESAQDKTEKPSQTKIRKAREDGNLPRSKELTTALLLTSSSLLIGALSERLYTSINIIFEKSFHLSHDEIFSPNAMIEIFVFSIDIAFKTIIPLFIALMLVSIFSNLALGGWNFSSKSLSPKISKLNPISGIKKIVSIKSFIELIKSILKIIIIFSALYYFLNGYLYEIIHIEKLNASIAFTKASSLIISCFMIYGAALILIALLDVPYSKWDYEKQLKMTKQEVKEENKNIEGKPEVKGRIRQLQRQLSQRKLSTSIPQADVIITNPTHYAVAIKYDITQARAPFVVAKGVDLMAMQIKTIAKKHNKPILELPPLTRAIYYTTNENQEIPSQLYVATAHVLTYIFQLEQYRKGKNSHPPKIPNINIPKELIR
ncbi:flagellar biosynthesis protein FlhB [Vibrio harveyi]|nr:flagellar biosynthesis protein FlhB [Vibrio harveyi]